jgi:hypothetical protein
MMNEWAFPRIKVARIAWADLSHSSYAAVALDLPRAASLSYTFAVVYAIPSATY